MGDFNIYNMTSEYSKNSIKKNRNFRAQRAKYLAEQEEKRKQEEANEVKLQENTFANARFSYAAGISKVKARQNSIDESIRYQNNSSTVAMSEMVTDVVLEALPLDKDEFKKMDPNYKNEIRETVTKLLESGNINEDIHNKDTLSLMEYVGRTIPDVKVGKSLTEDELRQYIESNKNINVDEAIKNLSGNVGSRVAKLLEKEQDRVAEIDADVGKSKAAKAEAEKNAQAKQAAPEETDDADEDQKSAEDAVSQFVEAISNGDMTIDDFSDLVDSGEVPEEIADAVISQLSASGVIDDDGDMTVQDQEDPNAEATEAPEKAAATPYGDPNATSVPTGSPKKQIQMLPDGTMNINVYESVLVRETPRCGLLETLAVNEARNMIHEGKGFDSDLCLAKAIMYVTLTESMSEMGLLNFTDKEYENICESAGGSLFAKRAKRAKNSIVVKRKIKNEHINETDPKKITKAVKAKSSLQERVLSTDYTVRTNKSNSYDLAERLRQKRLMQEQGKLPANNIINE